MSFLTSLWTLTTSLLIYISHSYSTLLVSLFASVLWSTWFTGLLDVQILMNVPYLSFPVYILNILLIPATIALFIWVYHIVTLINYSRMAFYNPLTDLSTLWIFKIFNFSASIYKEKVFLGTSKYLPKSVANFTVLKPYTFNFIASASFWVLTRLNYVLNSWVYTTNHKRIAINYFNFVLVSGTAGMSLATVIRLEFAYPGIGILVGDSLQYLSIATAHGVIMVFFMIMPAIFGGFGNFLLPTQLGVHDVAFPRLNSAAFWFLPGGLIMLCQLICIDRRYQRLNCFNMRQLETILRRQFYTDFLSIGDHRTLMTNSMIGLRFKLNHHQNFQPDQFSFYNLGLKNTKTLHPIFLGSGLRNWEVDPRNYLTDMFMGLYNYCTQEIMFWLRDSFSSYVTYINPSFRDALVVSLDGFTRIPNKVTLSSLYDLNSFGLYNKFSKVNPKTLPLEYSQSSDTYEHSFSVSQSSQLSYDSGLNISDTADSSNTGRFVRFTNPMVEYEYRKGTYFTVWADRFPNLMTSVIELGRNDYFAQWFRNKAFKTLFLEDWKYFTENFTKDFVDNSLDLSNSWYSSHVRPTTNILNIFYALQRENVYYTPTLWEGFVGRWDKNRDLLKSSVDFQTNTPLLINDFLAVGPKTLHLPFFYRTKKKHYSFSRSLLVDQIKKSENNQFYKPLVSPTATIFSKKLEQLFKLPRLENFESVSMKNFMRVVAPLTSDLSIKTKLSSFTSKSYQEQLPTYEFVSSFIQFNTVNSMGTKLLINYNLSLLESASLNFNLFESVSMKNFMRVVAPLISDLSTKTKLISFTSKSYQEQLPTYEFVSSFIQFNTVNSITLKLITNYNFSLLESASLNFNLFESVSLKNYMLVVTPLTNDFNTRVLLCTETKLSNFVGKSYQEQLPTCEFVSSILQLNMINSITPKLPVNYTLSLFESISLKNLVHVVAPLTSDLNTKTKLSNFVGKSYREQLLTYEFASSVLQLNMVNSATSKLLKNYTFNLGVVSNIFTNNYTKTTQVEPLLTETFQFRWSSNPVLKQKYYRLFTVDSTQQRIVANWRELKFTREAWRCKLLVSRHQTALFRRFTSEDNLFWAIERNAKDLLPGWAMITPFSARTRYTAVGKTDIGLVAVFIVLNSSIISSANFLITYRYLSTLNNRKMRDARSFFTEGLITASWMMIAANPMLMIGIIMLLSDRHWQTSFFDYSGGGDAILFQHMFWFFGHPEVYVIMLPVFGYVNTILSFFLRKRISARGSLLYSMYTIAFLGFFVWGHHMYMVGLSHTTRMLFSTLTVMISVPAATKLMHWSVTVVNSFFTLELPLLFTLTFIFFFVSGGVSGMYVANTGMDVLFHDTFYVIGHFHVMFAGSAMIGIFAAFYFYFPALYGVKYSRVYGYIHYTYYIIGQLMTVIPMLWLGYCGQPRRVLDYPSAFGSWHSISSAGHLLSVAAMLSFFIMIYDSVRQSKPAVRNNFGIGRFNTRLNFYFFEIHRLKFTQQKNFIYKRSNHYSNFRLEYPVWVGQTGTRENLQKKKTIPNFVSRNININTLLLRSFETSNVSYVWTNKPRFKKVR